MDAGQAHRHNRTQTAYLLGSSSSLLQQAVVLLEAILQEGPLPGHEHVHPWQCDAHHPQGGGLHQHSMLMEVWHRRTGKAEALKRSLHSSIAMLAVLQ